MWQEEGTLLAVSLTQAYSGNEISETLCKAKLWRESGHDPRGKCKLDGLEDEPHLPIYLKFPLLIFFQDPPFPLVRSSNTEAVPKIRAWKLTRGTKEKSTWFCGIYLLVLISREHRFRSHYSSLWGAALDRPSQNVLCCRWVNILTHCCLVQLLLIFKFSKIKTRSISQAPFWCL